ncbi:MAG: chemotaxis protein CheW [Actinobacteria bacterium]|nr:chemotaxis protein CheW [Actinomycetota bacterium]MCL5887046.1 chemotaxis protein CheW [Actinomycetota bacterium]
MSRSENHEAVANPVTPAALSGDIQQVVAFRLGESRFCLPIQVVQEIQQVVEFSQSETQQGLAVGMMNLRGAVIPVFYLREFLGLSPRPYDIDTPMIICKVADGFVSMIVDEVDDVVVLPEGSLSPAPALHPLADVMLGVCRLNEELVVLLDVEGLLLAGADRNREGK